MTLLTAAQGYGLWAQTYERETAITLIEQGMVAAMTPPLASRRLLDAGCGTGRRLRGIAARSAVGIEASAEMIRAGSAQGAWPDTVQIVEGDVRALPLVSAQFDIVWCRLVIGHLADCRPAYAELARVAAPGARLVVTDFHPHAYEAGHRRTFRHEDRVFEIEHHVHGAGAQCDAAAATGLDLVEVREGTIGPQVRALYEEAGKLDLYEASYGLPVVLALSFRRPD